MRYSLPFYLLAAALAIGWLGACQQPSKELAEPHAARVTTTPLVSDSLFLGLVFPYAPPKSSGPVTQAALLMTRQGAPIEKVILGTFEGRATVLDSLETKQFPAGALLGFRTYYATAGTDVAVLRANDTTLHVLSRPIRGKVSAPEFNLLKEIPIAAGSRLRVVN